MQLQFIIRKGIVVVMLYCEAAKINIGILSLICLKSVEVKFKHQEIFCMIHFHIIIQ